MVMAFGREEAYEHIDFPSFFIAYPDEDPSDPDALTSIRGDGTRAVRNGFGSALFRYAKFVHAYDPISGQVKPIAPARQLMFTYLTRWARDFHIDGIRMDSVENVANWDFVGDFKDLGHRLFQQRWNEQESDPAKATERFLVVVVVANFSDFVTANASSPGAEYRVSNWPPTPPGRQWREVTQGRFVPQEFVGREPIFPWEAKVYTLACAAYT